MNGPGYIKISYSVIQKKQMTRTFSGSNFLKKNPGHIFLHHEAADIICIFHRVLH